MNQTSDKLSTRYFQALAGERPIDLRAARCPSRDHVANRPPIPLAGRYLQSPTSRKDDEKAHPRRPPTSTGAPIQTVKKNRFP